MTILLNNTILSNFSTVARPDLVRWAFAAELTVTVEAVLAEHREGVARRYFPECDWTWLSVLSLTPAEQKATEELPRHLGRGESACLAVAQARSMSFATDDWDARRTAQRMGIPITGTIGILIVLVRDGKLTDAEADALLSRMVIAGFHTPVTNIKNILES